MFRELTGVLGCRANTLQAGAVALQLLAAAAWTVYGADPAPAAEAVAPGQAPGHGAEGTRALEQDASSPSADKGPSAGRYAGLPYKGEAQVLPGKLECELYDTGGEGVAYHEVDGRNHGSGELNKGDSERDSFRKAEDVDLSYTKDKWDNSEFNLVPQELGRFYLGWTAGGEWVRYTVEIARAGRYSLGVMYTSRYDGGILVKCDDRAAGAPIRLASTADARDERRNWHHWNHHLQKDALSLPAGRHVLTILILDPGNLNLDRLEFLPAD